MKNPHIDYLCERCPQVLHLIGPIETAFQWMRDSYRAGGKLLLCSNGGSASDADHWAGELLKGFKSKRPLPAAQRTGLPPEIAGHLQGGLAAIPLPVFSALNTAFGNDVDFRLGYA